jgi:hypothetical protein
VFNFNPSGSTNSQLIPENVDLERNKVIPIYVQVFLACAPMRRFM